jgi:hypothetical protein
MGWVKPIAGFNCPAGLAVAALLRSIQRLSPRRPSRIERIPNNFIGNFRFHLLQVHQERHI